MTRLEQIATVEIVKTAGDAAQVDELLWRVLWRPLGFPRNIRSSFDLDGEKLELAAKVNGKIIGGLVAVWTAEDEVELRHVAVASSHQRKGIGQSLIAELCRIASDRMCRRIHTIARNTSAGFFETVGFQAVAKRAPDHPVFLEHGVTFEIMEMSERGDR